MSCSASSDDAPVLPNQFIARQVDISVDEAARVRDPVVLYGQAVGPDLRSANCLVVEARSARQLDRHTRASPLLKSAKFFVLR